MIKLECTVISLLLICANSFGGDKVKVTVSVSYANDDLKRLLEAGSSSVEFVRLGERYDPHSMPLELNESKSVLRGEASRDEIQGRKSIFLVLDLAPKEIFRYHMGDLKEDAMSLQFEFDFHITPISIDLTDCPKVKSAVEKIGGRIPGHMEAFSKTHAFTIPVMVEKSRMATSKFLSLPADKYDVTIKLFPRYSESDTGLMEFKTRKPITHLHGKPLSFKLSEKDCADN